jgi:hypothetical protein
MHLSRLACLEHALRQHDHGQVRSGVDKPRRAEAAVPTEPFSWDGTGADEDRNCGRRGIARWHDSDPSAALDEGSPSG